MNWEKPTAKDLRAAADTYLAIAYEDGTIPQAVRTRREALDTPSEADLYEQTVFETDKSQPPARLSLRLGNRSYPHMKLVIERSPDGRGHLFRADTHDVHCRPAPGSRDYAAFTALMTENQRVAEAIESAWALARLPTFKQYLKQDLARRAAAAKP